MDHWRCKKRIVGGVQKIEMFNKIIIILLIVGVVTRFLWLDIFPPGLSHDENEYYINSRSYFLNKKDISGYGLPTSLVRTETEGRISPIVPIILSVYNNYAPNTQFAIKLPFVFMNLLTAMLLFMLTRFLFDKKTALLASVVFLLSPWSFFLSRWSAENAFVLFFYLLGIYLFLSAKNSKIYFLSFISFCLGFFSYHGAKLILIPLVLVLSFYKYKFTKFIKKPIYVFIVSILILFSSYIVIEHVVPGSVADDRRSDIVFLNNELLASEVNSLRKLQIENPINRIFVNKLTVATSIFSEKYLSSFSPETLFISGDPRATYRFESYGLFSLYVLVFLAIGLLKMYKHERKKFILLMSLVLIAPITTAVSTVDTSVIHRSFLLLPLIVIISAYGVSTIIHNRAVMVVSVVAILFSYVSFLHFYFSNYTVAHQENTFYSERLAIEYGIRSNEKIYFITSNPRAVFVSFLAIADKSTSDEIIKDMVIKNDQTVYNVDNFVFTNECVETDDSTVFVARDSVCYDNYDSDVFIQDPKDAGGIFMIVNDNLCKEPELAPWKRFNLLEDYKLSSLSNENFCKKWINKIDI